MDVELICLICKRPTKNGKAICNTCWDAHFKDNEGYLEYNNQYKR